MKKKVKICEILLHFTKYLNDSFIIFYIQHLSFLCFLIFPNFSAIDDKTKTVNSQQQEKDQKIACVFISY